MKNSRIKNGIMRIVQGIIIGAGAILPGISGGVLAVVFGIYRPAMELLTAHQTLITDIVAFSFSNDRPDGGLDQLSR